MSATLINDAVPGGPWAVVARFLTQYPTGNRAEALHLALQSLRARVEPDRVLACELAWEMHAHGYWSQIRRLDGSPSRPRRPTSVMSSAWLPGARPTSGWRSAAC